MKARRIIVTLIIVAFVLVTVFSHAFIALKDHHDCSGTDCLICHTIAFVENTIKEISLLSIALFIGSVFCCLNLKPLASKIKKFVNLTLITLKVKLSN